MPDNNAWPVGVLAFIAHLDEILQLGWDVTATFVEKNATPWLVTVTFCTIPTAVPANAAGACENKAINALTTRERRGNFPIASRRKSEFLRTSIQLPPLISCRCLRLAIREATLPYRLGISARSNK
jgi:hypothetical protein